VNIDERIYIHEDVHLLANMAPDYLDNMGPTWPFSDEVRSDLVFISAQLRPAGRWPRAATLWETTAGRLVGYLGEQHSGNVRDAEEFEQWWRRSLKHRSGGHDRFLVPGPKSPAMADLGPCGELSCLLEQVISVRSGLADEYLEWVEDAVVPSVSGTGWRGLMWLKALHGSEVYLYFAGSEWSAVDRLAGALPFPDPAFEATTSTALLRPWAASGYLTERST
jgi:hypothetical protein